MFVLNSEFNHFSISLTGQGIGKGLMEESINIAKTNGFEVIQCMALSYYTHKICEKQGYEVLYR